MRSSMMPHKEGKDVNRAAPCCLNGKPPQTYPYQHDKSTACQSSSCVTAILPREKQEGMERLQQPANHTCVLPATACSSSCCNTSPLTLQQTSMTTFPYSQQLLCTQRSHKARFRRMLSFIIPGCTSADVPVPLSHCYFVAFRI